MLRRGLALVVVMAGLAAAAAGAAHAIEGGAPDAANQYAGVGLVVFYGSNGRPITLCTGALISPTVLLTAGHCAGVEPSGAVPVRAQVWFGNGYPSQIPRGTWNATNGDPCEGVPGLGYPCTGDVGGTPVPHPDWPGFFDVPNTHDIGVVVLDHAVSLPTYPVAPTGTLDALAKKRGQDTSLTVVGYGVQVEAPTIELLQRTRYVGNVKVTNLNSSLVDGYNVRISASPGNGTGGSGICTGDSGGPLLQDGRIVAVASFSVGKYCSGNSGAFRVDTAQAQTFLAPYLP